MNLKRYEDYILEYDSYLKFLRKYRKNDKPYEDHSFHPFKKIMEIYNYIDPKKIEWRRIDKVYKTSLFEESCIGIDYMKQGKIGDCCLMSALLRIAKEPPLVRKLFDTECNSILGLDEDSIDLECGAVVVIFHAFGQTTPVVIDTLIPFLKNTDTPLFSRPLRKDASPWFCLVEKAYAKLNGSYSNIKGCKFYNVFYSLFNFWPSHFPISDLVKNEEKSPYKQILDYLNKGSIMSTSIHLKVKNLTKNQLEKVGLVEKHSYLIEEVFNFKRKIFYRLRNPWGYHEWNGDWSNNSPLWTEEMKKKFQFDKLKSGSFWIIESDFLKYFTDINISSPIHSFYHSKSFSIEMNPGESDGISPFSKKAKIDEKPNYLMRIIEDVPKDEKVTISFFIEKKSYLLKKDDEDEDYDYDDDNDDEDSKDDDHDDKMHKQIKFDVLLAWSNGKRLTNEVLNKCVVRKKHVKRDLFSFSFNFKKTKSPLTIALHRVKKSNYQDECFIKILCKYKFELFEIDEPEDKIEDDKEEEDIFHNQKLVHLILSKKKADFIPKIHPIMISQGVSLKLTDDPDNLSDKPDILNDEQEMSGDISEIFNDRPKKASDHSEKSNDDPEILSDVSDIFRDEPKNPKEKPKKAKDIPEKSKEKPKKAKDIPEKSKDKREKTKNIPEKTKNITKKTKNITEKPKNKPEKQKLLPTKNTANKNEIEINAENLIYYEQEKGFMKLKIKTLEDAKQSFTANVDKYLEEKNTLQRKIQKNIKKTQITDDESKIVRLINRIESKRNQLEINENFLDWNFSKIDEIQSEIQQIKEACKMITKKIKSFKDNQPKSSDYDE